MSVTSKRWSDYFGLVRFSHSIFALPFALQGAWLAARGVPPLGTLGWILVACVAARTAAMGFNRWADAASDAKNPRTRGREIPAGRLGRGEVLLLVLVSAAVFVGAAFALGNTCGLLALPVLGVLLGYSLMKRVSWTAHFVLGAALGIAPMGAWLGVRGDFGPGMWEPVLLGVAVLTWVAGFDLIYACQDADFDRGEGLHSIPARFGVAAALRASSVLHVATVALLVALAWWAGLGVVYAVSIAVCALLLAWEHRIVSPDDLSRVNAAFFTLNGWVGIGLFVGLALDLAL